MKYIGDWETSGQDEMNEIYIKIKENQCQTSKSKSDNTNP